MSIYKPKCAESNFKKLIEWMLVFPTFLKKVIWEKTYFLESSKVSKVLYEILLLSKNFRFKIMLFYMRKIIIIFFTIIKFDINLVFYRNSKFEK